MKKNFSRKELKDQLEELLNTNYRLLKEDHDEYYKLVCEVGKTEEANTVHRMMAARWERICGIVSSMSELGLVNHTSYYKKIAKKHFKYSI